MNPTDISKILDILVERLGPMGQATWETMLKQVQIIAIMQRAWGLVCCVLTLVLMALGAVICWREAHKEYNQDESPGIACFFFAALPAVIAGLLFTASYQRYANPAYYAIKLLLGR